MTIRRRYQELTRGQPISAGEMNRALRSVERMDSITGGGFIDLGRTTAVDGYGDQDIWIQITGGTNPYSWIEVIDNAAASDRDDGDVVPVFTNAGIRSGTTTVIPAWEINGVATVPVGTIARAYFDPAAGGRYLFAAPILAKPVPASSSGAPMICIPIPVSFTGAAVCVDGQIQITLTPQYQYLYAPADAGLIISDVPCE